MNSIILRAGARYIAGLLLLFSIYMLIRGHNEPGGGFIGGLIGSTGFVIFALSNGPADTRRALRVMPQNIAMTGLGISLLAGLSAGIFGDPLFSGQWLFINPDETSKGLPISSVLFFDIGVYLVVFGSILSLVLAMEEEI